jgi:UDPglucose 6-dehydrogenase
VVIGHIYSTSSRPEDIDALKKLYTPFVPAERIVTMDAYSAELGRMSQTAVLAQQAGAMASLGLLSARCEASNGAVGWMLGLESDAGLGSTCGVPGFAGVGLGGRFKEVRSEGRCLVSMARELGMDEVAEYWGALLRLQEFLVRRAVKGLIKEVRTDEEDKSATTAIAVLGFEEEMEMGTIVVNELRTARLNVKLLVLGNNLPSQQIQCELEHGEGIDLVNSIEAACSECSGVVLLDVTSVQAEVWQVATTRLKERKVLSLGGHMDGVKMKQLGFEVL